MLTPITFSLDSVSSETEKGPKNSFQVGRCGSGSTGTTGRAITHKSLGSGRWPWHWEEPHPQWCSWCWHLLPQPPQLGVVRGEKRFGKCLVSRHWLQHQALNLGFCTCLQGEMTQSGVARTWWERGKSRPACQLLPTEASNCELIFQPLGQQNTGTAAVPKPKL